jgi:penicillin-binding protein 1A
VFEKLREAAMAYHLARKWPKQKILTEYLNSIYYGNGAYGVESAARTYFGDKHGFDRKALPGQGQGCGDSTPQQQLPECSSVLQPYEAALLAGMVASPSMFDPIAHPVHARRRRNLVLLDMYRQHYITAAQYYQGIAEPLPAAADIQQPVQETAAPYFTSWLTPQILAAVGRNLPPSVGAYRAYYGGLTVKTSLDLALQQAAQNAINAILPVGSGLPDAALVAIDNKTGEVRAMVSGANSGSAVQEFENSPFNLATEGERQPGSSFKPFTLAVALRSGISPDSVWTSAPVEFTVPNSAGKEHFVVHNFGNAYSGSISLAAATAVSDNSVYARLGIEGLAPNGPKKVAKLAKEMGIRTAVSDNYAMILGGLRIGVSPLDMAHAYATFAEDGLRVYNPELGAPDEGPIGIESITCPQKPVKVCNRSLIVNHPSYQRVLPAWVAKTVHDVLAGVVQSGTGTQAAIQGVDVVGKTGTTSNYGDAWFVGWTPQITTAVWVGFPTRLVSMATMFNGQPVEGGTYPAIIWHDFMTQALQIYAQEAAAAAAAAAARQHPAGSSTTTTTTGTSTSAPTGGSSTTPPPVTTAPATTGTTGTGGAGTGTTGGAGSGQTGGAGATGGGGTAGGGGTGATGGGGSAGGGGTGATGGGGTAGGGGGGTGATGGGGTAGGGGGTGATGGGGGSGGGGSGGAGIG